MVRLRNHSLLPKRRARKRWYNVKEFIGRNSTDQKEEKRPERRELSMQEFQQETKKMISSDSANISNLDTQITSLLKTLEVDL